MARAPKAPAILDASIRMLILCGAEPMQKEQAYNQLKAALEKEHGSIEVFKFDGGRTPLSEVFDELRTFSLMQSYKVVVVDDADQFVKEHREALQRYAEAPVDNATLVLRSTNWNSPKLDKLVAKVGAKIKAEPLSAAKAKSWVIDRAKKNHQRTIKPQAAQMLIDRMGTGLMRLDSELAKLALLVDEKEPIGPDLIETVAGRSSDEKAWVVQEAVLQAAMSGGKGQLQGGAAIEKVHELVDLSGQPEVLVMYFVADLTRKLFLASQMKRQGMNEGQIARAMKLWPRERATLFMDMMRRLDGDSAGRLFDRVIDADRRSKSGYGNAMRNLECFCAALADV